MTAPTLCGGVCMVCVWVWVVCGCGGGGSDVELDAHLCRYTSVGAPNWGGRTPGSQTPGVPATLGLNVQMDGGRKMLQNCNKITPPSPLEHPVCGTKGKPTTFEELQLRDLHSYLRCLANGTRRTKNGHVHRDQELHLWESPQFSARLDHTREAARPAQQGRRSLCPATLVRQTVGPWESASAQRQEICTTLPKNWNWGISTVFCAV